MSEFQPNPLFVPVSVEKGESDEIFRLVKADMQRAVDECNRIVTEAMFSNGSLIDRPPLPPLTRLEKFRRRYWWPVYWYLHTLWRALKGDELTDPYEE